MILSCTGIKHNNGSCGKQINLNSHKIHPITHPHRWGIGCVLCMFQKKTTTLWQLTGPWFNIKMSFYQYRKSHCGDKTVVRSSYLHNGISYTGKMSSLYWIRALDCTVSKNKTQFHRIHIMYSRWSCNPLVPHPPDQMSQSKWLISKASLTQGSLFPYLWLIMNDQVMGSLGHPLDDAQVSWTSWP